MVGRPSQAVAVTAVTLYGWGEGVYLLWTLEENTRTKAELLRENRAESG